MAVALLNRGGAAATIATTAAQVGLATTSTYTVKDLWTKSVNQTSGTLSASVPSHGVVMYRVTGAGLSPSPSASPSASASVSPSGSASRSASPTPSGTAGCTAAYQIVGSWQGGFQAQVTVTNTGPPGTAWTLTWTFPDAQVISQAWGGTAAQSGAAVTVTNASWNGTLGTGATASVGFLASQGGTNRVPTDLGCHIG